MEALLIDWEVLNVWVVHFSNPRSPLVYCGGDKRFTFTTSTRLVFVGLLPTCGNAAVGMLTVLRGACNLGTTKRLVCCVFTNVRARGVVFFVEVKYRMYDIHFFESKCTAVFRDRLSAARVGPSLRYSIDARCVARFGHRAPFRASSCRCCERVRAFFPSLVPSWTK